MATSITAGLVGVDATVDNADSTDLLDGTIALSGVKISVSGSSAAPLKVRVRNAAEDTHGTTSMEIAVGESEQFWAFRDNPIKSILVEGDGGTATFSWHCTLR